MGDVVVITGASGGIGRATARRFADDGARIALLARGEAGLEGIATEVVERGGEALVLPTDVADAKEVEAAAQVVESKLGPIDIWINDAMATIYSEFLVRRAGRVPARHRRHLPRHGLGNPRGAEADVVAQPRHDRPGRLGTRLPRDPTPGALLRR